MLEKGATLQCATNIRTLGGAMTMYAEDTEHYAHTREFVDTDGRTKWISYDSELGIGGYDGRELTFDQAKKYRIGGLERSAHPDMIADMYQCPKDTGSGFSERTSNAFFRTYVQNGHASIIAYKYGRLSTAEADANMELGIVAFAKTNSSGIGYPDGWGAMPTGIPYPSETIMLTEMPDVGILGNQYLTLAAQTSDQIKNDSSLFDLTNILYHNSGYNYQMVDGSVKNLLPQETSHPDYPITVDRSYGLWSRGDKKL
jgi:prepilin-type processing-associated H-X9-DG protein